MTAREPKLRERDRFVEDLLSYMTLEEKLGQLNLFHRADDPAIEAAVAAGRVGGICGAPYPLRLQALATERSRLGIPLLLSDCEIGQAVSPWALAASWDEHTARNNGAAAARTIIEGGFNAMAAPGVGFLPTDDGPGTHIVTCDTHLATRLATAFAEGAAAAGHDPRSTVLAIPSWRSAAIEHALSWSLGMVCAKEDGAIDSSVLDSRTAQRAGFAGLLASECRRISALVARQFAVTSARSTIEAAERLIANGLLNDAEIDTAVRGVLAAKHSIGLFREPQRVVAPPGAGIGMDSAADMVRRTFVLLRNEAGLLPLSPVSDKVLVVGSATGAGGACADALNRAGIGHAIAPGLAQRRADEGWDEPIAGDTFALSLTSDAARRADFVLVVLEDRHFGPSVGGGWRRPTAITQAMLRGLSLCGTRLVAVIATAVPVDLAEADQYFAASTLR